MGRTDTKGPTRKRRRTQRKESGGVGVEEEAVSRATGAVVDGIA
mgnify:CR=1 FL=1